MITPYELDCNLFLSLNGDGGWLVDQIMWYASAKFTWIPLYAAIVWWIWRKNGWQYALRFLIAALLIVLVADQVSSFFKHYTPKFRPTHFEDFQGLVHTVNGYVGGLYGTVSAHAANTVGIAILSGVAIGKRWVTISLAIWVLLVCYSRIYLGVHYPFDIMFGLVDGVVCGVFFVWILRLSETWSFCKVGRESQKQ